MEGRHANDLRRTGIWNPIKHLSPLALEGFSGVQPNQQPEPLARSRKDMVIRPITRIDEERITTDFNFYAFLRAFIPY
jgi:hypothetical protein